VESARSGEAINATLAKESLKLPHQKDRQAWRKAFVTYALQS